MHDIEYLETITKKDEEALKNSVYKDIICDINFENLLVNKPWGSEYLLFENKHCAIWGLSINYLENTSMHCHVNKDTSLVCIDGQVSCNNLNSKNILNPCEATFLSKKIFHQTQSICKDGSFVLEIEIPVNKFDLVRLNDTYGRQGKEYENKKHYIEKKNLTLNISTNVKKQINNTNIEILTINSLKQLDIYNKDSLIAILSKSKILGKIFKLSNIKKDLISGNTTVLLISKNTK